MQAHVEHLKNFATAGCSSLSAVLSGFVQQYNTLFNHATFRSEKHSLKHVRAKNNVYN